jgi:subtilisin
MKISKYLAYMSIFLLGLSSCKKENQKAEEQQMIDQQGPLVTNASDNWKPIPNQYIVTYKNGSAATADVNNAANYSLREAAIRNHIQLLFEKHSISSQNLIKTFHSGISGFSAVLSQDEVKKLQSEADVENIEPDRIVHLSNNLVTTASQSTQKLPWGIKKTGSADGTGKTCWIIDTGIDFTHPDLNADQARSKSFLSTDSSAADMNGHGTHVAGIIGAKDNNFGVIGVAPNASLIALRALDANGSGNLSDVIAAVNWASAHAKAGDVVNMSIGGSDDSPTLNSAVYNASMKGIYFAIAAGNDGKSATLNSPGNVNSTYICTVSAMNSNDNFASFSNFGNPPIDWCAPGVGILSTYMGSRYAILSGTSMATPHVAGLLLLDGQNIKSSGSVKNDPDRQPDKMAHL